jgi:hypothetical protein
MYGLPISTQTCTQTVMMNSNLGIVPKQVIVYGLLLNQPASFHRPRPFSSCSDYSEECLIINPLNGQLQLCSTVPDAQALEEQSSEDSRLRSLDLTLKQMMFKTPGFVQMFLERIRSLRAVVGLNRALHLDS